MNTTANTVEKTINRCFYPYTCQISPHHPDGVFKGFHSLYEAEEKSVYICKLCGHKEKNIRNLVVKKCPKSPKGVFKGNHEISKI